jgi:ubiquinone/menaquinone biosynthesis C-methylase UbiE
MIKAQKFWDKEYDEDSEGELFKLSKNAGSDFVDFIKWLEKIDGKGAINKNTFWLDAGCGNGRHGLYLVENYGASGLGYDISSSAISSARESMSELIKKSQGTSKSLKETKADFIVQNMNQKMNVDDESVDIVIEAMSNHVLKEKERAEHLEELCRVIKYKGYLFLKTFLRDGDELAADLIYKYPGEDKNSYIHPKINIYEHVPSEAELIEMYSLYFDIEHIVRSHFHREKGKRRYIVLYLRRK